MMYNERTKQLYLAHPRTASSSTERTLAMIDWEPICSPHSTIDKFEPYGDADKYRVYTTVRNPWDLAVSLTIERNDEPVNFKPSVEDFRRALDHEKWFTEDTMFMHLKHANQVMRFETIEMGMWHTFGIKMALRVANVHGEWKHSRLGLSYKDFYNGDTAEYIGKRFAREIDELGYQF